MQFPAWGVYVFSLRVQFTAGQSILFTAGQSILFAAGQSILFAVFCEAMVVSWTYSKISTHCCKLALRILWSFLV